MNVFSWVLFVVFISSCTAEELGMAFQCPRLFHDGENIIICKINKTAIKEANCKGKFNVVLFEWVDDAEPGIGCRSVYNTTEKCTTDHGHSPGSCWCAETSGEIFTYMYSYQANSTRDKGRQLKCSLCVLPQKHLKINISDGCKNLTFDDHEDSRTENKSETTAPMSTNAGIIVGVVLGVALLAMLLITVICIKKRQSFPDFCKRKRDTERTSENGVEQNELMSSKEGKKGGRPEQNGHSSV